MAQQEKKKMNRLRYMILSVIIAIIAWVVVTYTTDPDIVKTFSGIRVEFAGEDVLAENGYVVAERNDIPKVSVKMRGKRSDLINALGKTRVVVDVSDIDEAGTYELEGIVKIPTSRITVEKIIRETITIEVAKLQTKEVPISVVQTGELNGKLVKSTPTRDTVQIKGAEYELDLIDRAEVTVDISAIKDNNSLDLGYSLIISDGILREELSTLRIFENVVTVNNTVYMAKEVPVRVLVRNGGAVLDESATKIDPQTVTVGTKDGKDVEFVTVTIDADSENGEYKLDKTEDVYIPESSRTVTIKPIWNRE